MFELPVSLAAAAATFGEAGTGEAATEDTGEEDEESSAWEKVLQVPFSQLGRYAEYIEDRTAFGTHQGVKGLEFRDVMVIIDDYGARGFLFSYEKLFGLKAKTDADRKNEAAGKETTIERTRRLLYVTCSRAENSVALIAYTAHPAKLAAFLSSSGWFSEDEIELVV